MVTKVLLFRSKNRLILEEDLDTVHDLWISAVLVEKGIIKEFTVEISCRVGVCQPGEKHLLDSVLSIRHTICALSQVFVNSLCAGINNNGRKMLIEGFQSSQQLGFAKRLLQMCVKRMAQGFAVCLIVLIDNKVKNLV